MAMAMAMDMAIDYRLLQEAAESNRNQRNRTGQEPNRLNREVGSGRRNRNRLEPEAAGSGSCSKLTLHNSTLVASFGASTAAGTPKGETRNF